MDLADVFRILLPVAIDWQTIGTLIRIPPEVLANIRTIEREVPINCLRSMLEEMLKLTDPPPTWKALAEAVELINPAKAKEIREKYVGGDQQSPIERSSTTTDGGTYSEVKKKKVGGSYHLSKGGELNEWRADSCTPDSGQTSIAVSRSNVTANDTTESTDLFGSEQVEVATGIGGMKIDRITIHKRTSEPDIKTNEQGSDIDNTDMSTQMALCVSEPPLQELSLSTDGEDTSLNKSSVARQSDSAPSAHSMIEAHSSSKIAVVSGNDDVENAREKYALLQTPRGYQKELAQPGIRGENYIICLPTGTGKTLVASMVIADHLKRKMEGGKQGKVLFIVPTQHLAYQQKKKLEEYVDGITAVEVTGGTDETFIHPLLSQVDAIVCTPGKLRHELYRKKIKMSQFSLIVLDECHHAVGLASHYGDVMEFYLMEKLSQLATSSTHSMPQVIGMTASPGAGKNRSPNLQKTIEHQITLCARIDATSGIKTNDSEELRKYENRPLRLANVIERRKSDEPFIQLVTSTMGQLEALLQEGGPPHEKGSFKYKQWAEGEITAAQLRSENQRDKIAILEHLAEFSLALTTYEDFRFEDAMEIITVMPQTPQDTATVMEQFIDQIRAKLCQGLKSLPKIPNPLLDAVEQLLLKQFHDSPESRGIFFVRAIKHTQFVSKWVEQSPRLSKLVRVSAITGHTRAGMSKSEQNRIMEAFHKGEYNLLVSTSVLHEGIDVPACNFVIRFQHITNEVAEIQARGRARADNSKMYTVMSTSSPMQYNQLLQDEKEKLANLAIPLLSLVDLSDMLLMAQNKIIQKRRQKELAAQLHRKRWNASEVELLCNKCKTVACEGSDVFTYGVGVESHYVVPDTEFEEQFVKRVHTKPDATVSMVKVYKIACKRCNNDWGIIARWTKKGVLTFPVLKCRQFTFKCRGQMEYFKQWKLVPFQVQPLFDTDSDEEESHPEPLELSDPTGQ